MSNSATPLPSFPEYAKNVLEKRAVSFHFNDELAFRSFYHDSNNNTFVWFIDGWYTASFMKITSQVDFFIWDKEPPLLTKRDIRLEVPQ